MFNPVLIRFDKHWRTISVKILDGMWPHQFLYPRELWCQPWSGRTKQHTLAEELKTWFLAPQKWSRKKRDTPRNEQPSDWLFQGWLAWLALLETAKQTKKKQNRISSRERGSAFVKYWPYGFESPIVWCILLVFLMFNLNVCRQNWN